MPRRVFTYPANLASTRSISFRRIGAFILGGGYCRDLLGSRPSEEKAAYSERNPWGAGTLEWLQEMPGKPWGIRSIPEIDSRYPLWDQPNMMRDVDEGRFYLPDAEEGKRETIVTSVIDAKPEQCLRLPGSSFITLFAALTTGGFFIFGTYHLWWLALMSLALAIGIISYWLWTGTAIIPEKDEKDVGLGLKLPALYFGICVDRLVGDVHHDARRPDCIHLRWCLATSSTGLFTTDFPPDLQRDREFSGLSSPRDCCLRSVGVNDLRKALEQARLVERLATSALLFAIALAIGGGAALLAGPWVTGLDPDEPRLSGNGVDIGHLDGGTCRCRIDHATLLRRTAARWAHDLALRHRYLERGALLALRCSHRRYHSRRGRRISAGRVKTLSNERRLIGKEPKPCGC